MSLKGLDQNIWNKFDRELNFIWGENANLTFTLKILKIENVQKMPWSFCRRRKLPRTFSFPKATAFWGLMSPEAWVDGYWIFLISVRSDHWPAWRSPCHRRSRSSQVTRPRWLRGGRRPEMPALIAGPTLFGNVIGWFIKTQMWMGMRLSTVSLSEKVKYYYLHHRFTGAPPCLMTNM